MSESQQSPNQYTELSPQTQEKQQTVGQFISKIFRLNKTSLSASGSLSTSKSLDNIDQEVPNWALDPSANERCDSYYQVDVNEGRSLPNVLKRISNLLVLKSTNSQAYSDVDLKQYWMPDSVSKECYECGEKFTTFRRRHHCRVCGQIFCWACCNQQIPGKIFGYAGDLRVCTYCCKVVLSYLQSSSTGIDVTPDVKNLLDNLLNRYGRDASPSNLNVPGTSSTASLSSVNAIDSGTVRRKVSVGYQEEKFTLGRPSSGGYLTAEEKCKVLQNSVSLRNLYEEMSKLTTGVPLQTHRYKQQTYPLCFLGSELVDWLIYQQKANTRVQAATICQALLEGDYIECLCELDSFVDGYALYKLGLVSSEPVTFSKTFEMSTQDEPSWIQQVPHESRDSMVDSENEQMSPLQRQFATSSSYMLDLNIEANTVYLSRPSPSKQNLSSSDDYNCDISAKSTISEEVVKTSEQRELVPESGWHNPSHLRDENGEKTVFNLLTIAYKNHEENLMKQLLSAQGLSLSWSNFLISLVHEIVDVVRPDKNHNAEDIDIRQYVKFKKVVGNSRSASKLVPGIVCSKNIAHKDMANKISNPKILLLDGPLVYQRTEGRLMSLEPIVMQEHEYLTKVVARIAVLQPDIVLVQRTVARLAQDLLRNQGMTLVLNVKQTVLEHLARCTNADLISSMDAYIGKPKLGTCKEFYVKPFQIDGGRTKTLMFFEGLPLPHLGGTVLLTGASKGELVKVKQAASFFLFACYNWRLEKSFLMDEFAQAPVQKDEFFDESKENSPDLPITEREIQEEMKSQEKVTRALFADGENDADVFNNLGDAAEKAKAVTKVNTNDKTKEGTIKAVCDFSDPLLSGGVEDGTFQAQASETLAVAELPFSNTFRKSLDDTILCVSPYLVFPLPYLETEIGRKCKLRSFFPSEIFPSTHIGYRTRKSSKEQHKEVVDSKLEQDLSPAHPFTTTRVNTPASSREFQALLAHFRACGGRLEHKAMQCVKEVEENHTADEVHPHDSFIDALDPTNHQRLAVLFCSFSPMSVNAPAFCVKMVVYMQFYGINDIPLGCFLERYCFRPSYKCASKSCETPMLKHIRRFVHNGGCLSLSLNNFENGFGEDGIVMWNWCSKCQKTSPVVPMSKDTWSYSFAKYLELRFYGGIYNRRGSFGCQHSLHHDHYQYFGFKNLVASFKYSPVQLWEISLPPPVIDISYSTTGLQTELIDEIKTLALKGHEIFSVVSEKLAALPTDVEGLLTLKQILAKEQSVFKQRIEEVQLKLTSPTLENKPVNFGTIIKEQRQAMWRTEDAVIRIKRLIADSVEQWNLKLVESVKRKDSDKKREKSVTSDSSDSPLIADNVFDSEVYNFTESYSEDFVKSSGLTNKKIKSLDHEDETFSHTASSSPKVHIRSQSDGTVVNQYEEQTDTKKEADKKSVKTILSQLLPSSMSSLPIQSPFSQQEHYTLPTGVMGPIVVYENEPSSVVAYALNSYEYKKVLDELSGKKTQSVETSPSPVHKRRSHSDREKTESGDFSEKSGILSFLRTKESKLDILNTTPSSTTSDSNLSQSEDVAVEKSDDQKKGKSVHVEVQFLDHSSNFFCRVYYAERFAWLRSLVLPDGEEAYIRSLSRCVQWNAQGGKSGSTFCKTKDDRFVLKELPKSEIQLFLDSASNYFSYMQKCLMTGQPTLLGKMVGIYQIIFRNTSTNATLRTNLLVMENLFYNRTVTHKFDLKGSMRNRLVNADNQDSEIVLLDENLLRMTCEHPLYILPHSKAVLTAAIQNDTEFLSEQSVMDYSLLVGWDSDKKELILGIIDYIRTFTWDKKLETMVKKSGLLGGQGKLPTIISPKEYRKRFIEAMHRYFLVVPDHWAGLGKGLVEC